MTPYELAQIRIKTVEIFVETVSKVGLQSDVAFEKGDKLFEIIKKDIMQAGYDKAQLPRFWTK